MVSFPSLAVYNTLRSLDVPGSVNLSNVRFDPFLKLTITGLEYLPEPNPFVKGLKVRRLVARPAWSAFPWFWENFYVNGVLGEGHLEGFVRLRNGKVALSLSSPKPIPLPSPLLLKPGVRLEGRWEVKLDFQWKGTGNTAGPTGGWKMKTKNLHFCWGASPIGPIDLTFASGFLDGTLQRSVLTIEKLEFRGPLLDMEGNAVVWLDPLTRGLRLKGTLYLRPKVGLEVRNSGLDSAVRLLPKDPRGFRLAF